MNEPLITISLDYESRATYLDLAESLRVRESSVTDRSHGMDSFSAFVSVGPLPSIFEETDPSTCVAAYIDGEPEEERATGGSRSFSANTTLLLGSVEDAPSQHAAHAIP